MRITDKLNAYTSLKTTQTSTSNLYKTMNRFSSGMKIQNSYESAGTYITNARLEYEYATLDQVESSATLADELMKNTDSTMKEMVDLITQFKVKVTQAVNATQTPTSREVIAKELATIRQQIVDLANTSINGQFLFSGSLTNTKPFDYSGNYYGDAQKMFVVTGDGVKNAYNIPGYDLFFKADNDFKKQITTNVSFTDNRYDLINESDKTRYLDVDDQFKYLIGLNYVEDNSRSPLDPDTDFDLQPLQFPSTALYVQGVRPDGTSFKSAVLVEPNDTMQGLLDKIGALYGNTTTSKVVEVSLNKSGQIQITDLKQGNNTLDFHAVAFTPQFEDRDDLKNAFEDMAAQNPPMSGADLTNNVLNNIFNQQGNNDITTIGGSQTTLNINGNNYTINLHQTDFIFSRTTDSAGNTADAADYDNVYFETKNNQVYGNVSQIIQSSGAYATGSTRLSEVASGDLNNTTLNLTINSKAGRTYNVSINLGTSQVSYQNAAGQTITFPIMNTDSITGNTGVVTPTEDITYRQLNDIIGLFASDRQPTATINVGANNEIAAADYEAFQASINDSKVWVNVDLDNKGRITITDRLSTGTNISLSMHDSRSGTFPRPAQGLTTTATIEEGTNPLSFSANNALIIDEPHVDFINDLELMIEAVREGYVRADSTGANPRNTGMQGALERLDHLNEHVIKQRTIIGADQKAMSDTKTKVATLKVNVQSIQSEVIGVDIAEAYTQMMQQQLNYQAALKATTTLSQLSLLNYM